MKINFLMIKNTWDYLLLLSSSFNFGQKRNKGAALMVLLLLLTTTKGYSQCTFPTTTATKVGTDDTFCVDNKNTITIASVNAGQFVEVNVVQGFKYTFSVGNVFSDNETLTIFNSANVFQTGGTATGSGGASITNWSPSLTGKIKVLLSKGNCINDGTSGGILTLTLNSVGNTQDSQDDFGNNTWVAHVYNLSTSQIPPGGTSPATPTAAYPFLTANYVGNYNIASDKIDQDFGGFEVCLPVTSAATNIYTETFAVRYRMQSTKTGYYFLDVTGDDGVRVYVDDVLVFNEWKQQGPTNYCNILVYLTGTSKIVVDYYDSASQNIVKFNLTPFNASSNVIAGSNPINVCSGSSPGTLVAPAYVSCSPQTISNVVYQWQVSSDNSTWANVASDGNAKDYVVPTITTDTNNIRYFRRNLKQTAGNSTQPLSSSNVIRVNTSAANILGTTGVITGSTSQCASATGLVYSVGAVTKALNYAWTVPSGWNITAGQGTTSITVNTGDAGQNGNIGVTASNGCTANAVKTLAVTVSAIPTAVTAVASAITVCEGGSINLSATATANSNVTLLTQNFNAATNAWTKTNTSTGGTPANAAWTLRANNYNNSNTTFTSNDSSQFYLTNSDSQGNGGTTATTLRSPSFSTVGLSSASLSFYHYYRDYNGTDAAKVEISTDNGTNWTTLQTYTTTQGTNNAFVKATIDLSSSSYLGKANVSVRFKYNAVYSYYWAIDNVSVTGVSNTNSATYEWTSTPAGFTSSLQNPTGVKPTENTTYTVKVTNGSGCSATATTEMVVVNPNLPASVSIAANTVAICAGTSVTFTATPTNGGTSPTYQWKVNDSTITGAISSTYTTAALANNNTVSVIMTSNASPCSTGSPATSNILTMTVGTTAKYNNGWEQNRKPNVNGLDAVEIASDYSTTSGSFSACSCTVNAGVKLTIAKDTYVNIINNLKNDGVVIVESDGNLKQSNDLAVNTGNVTVKRNSNLKRLDYTYWASPVNNQNLKAFSIGTVNSRFYIYKESIDSFETIDPLTNIFGNGASGFESEAKGYAIRASNYYPVPVETAPAEMKVFEGIFTGFPNNGTKTFPLQNSANGHNLIGNPYMSNIDFQKLYENNSDKIYNTAYFWTNVNPNPEMQAGAYPKTGSINNYAVLNGTGAVGATTSAGAIGGSAVPNRFIKVGQGFIVKAKGVANLTFNNAIRTLDNTGPFFNRKSNDDMNRYWLTLTTPLGVVTTQLIGYLPAASHGFELDYDAPLLTLGSDAFYSVLENKKLMIQGKGNFGTDDIVPLGSSQYEAGTYKIGMGDREGIFANGQNIYLKDRQTGAITNLSEGDYTFTAAAGLTENRFEIIYRPETVLATDGTKKENIVVYRDGVDFVVKSALKTIDKIEMYDASGRLIHQVQPNAKEVSINSASYANGVYVLKITQAGTVTTKKVMK